MTAHAAANTAIERFLAADDGPGVLVVEGEAGIGKTTLWTAACDAASQRGHRVATARPSEAESVLAYAAVADLLDGVGDDVIDALPDLQRLAVNRVLLRADGDGPATDQRVVCAAVVAVLEALSHDGPVLVAVDDVQWLDSSSKAVVAFVARRLTGRIRILFTERCAPQHGTTTAWLRFGGLDDVAVVRLGPVTLGALHGLIRRKLDRSFSRASIVRIAEVSGGNPFYALELAREMDGAAPPSNAGLPGTLAELVRLRLGRLDADVRRVLLAVASVATPTVDLIARVSDSSTARVVELLEGVETDGVVTIEGNRVRFTHPLLARGIYVDASPSNRRAMHRALADLEIQPELKARHLALAATTVDDATLATLDAAADTARTRGAPAAAAELLELAIGLGGDKAWRRLRAAGDHFQAGDTTRARVLLEEVVEELRPGMLRAIALNLLGAIYIFDNRYAEALQLLTTAVDEAADAPALVVQALMSLSWTQGLGSFDSGVSEEELVEAVQNNARRAVEVAEDPGVAPSVRSQALAMWAHTRFMHGEGIDQVTIDRALDLEDDTDDVAIPFKASAVNALLLAWTGRLDDAAERMHAVRAHYEERGSDRSMMAVESYSALIEMWRGNLYAASDYADEAVARAQQLGGERVDIIPLSVRSVVAAQLGRETDARADATTALDSALACGAIRMANWPRMTLCFLEVSLGNHEAAVAAVAPLLAGLRSVPGTELMLSWYLPDAAEALIAVGRLEEADEIVDVLERNGRRVDRPWMLATAARCRAMALAARGDVAAAETAVQEALEWHTRLPMPFELARTQLLLGQLQRRRRLRDAALAMLREASSSFEQMGATLWVARAAGELARVKGRPSDGGLLTPSEQRVADLAATGLTNREIATTLFISPKTVEKNLGQVYQKLGIKNRAALASHLGRVQ